MLYIIHALDSKEGPELRKKNYAAHDAFLAERAKWGITIIMSGPLVGEDNKTPIGSHFVVEAVDLKTVETFHYSDPFYTSGVWGETSITAFIKRVG